MLRTLLIVHLALVASVHGACQPQDTKAIRACYKTFITAYGFDFAGENLPEYWDFHGKRDVWLANGLEVQPKIRDLGRVLRSCMDSYFDCVDKPDFIAMGQNETDAANYMSDLAITGWQTSDRGHYLLLKHHYCLEHCGSHASAELKACKTAYNNGKMSPELPVKCKALSDYLVCNAGVIADKCCGKEAAEFNCGSVRADEMISDEDFRHKCPSIAACPTGDQ